MSSKPTLFTIPAIFDALTTNEVYKPGVLDLLLARLEEKGEANLAEAVIQIQIDNSSDLHNAAARRLNELHMLHAFANRQLIETEVELRQAKDNHAHAKELEKQGEIGVEALARRMLHQAEHSFANATAYKEKLNAEESAAIVTKRTEKIRREFLQAKLQVSAAS
jgi:hypothetical protein